MARKKKGKKKSSKRKEVTEWLGFELNPETKHGILVVVLFAFAALLFLSLFNIAGSVGEVLDGGMAAMFGWDRFLFPVIIPKSKSTAPKILGTLKESVPS